MGTESEWASLDIISDYDENGGHPHQQLERTLTCTEHYSKCEHWESDLQRLSDN